MILLTDVCDGQAATRNPDRFFSMTVPVDLTERHQVASDARLRSTGQVSPNFLQTVIDAFPDAVMVIDLD